VTDAEWWAQVRRLRDQGQQTAGPAQLALWRMTKGRHVAEAVIRRVPGIGLELRYALDGELRSSQVHRDTAALAADAEGKRVEMVARGWVAA
jgi:hypothetical protein